MSRLACPARSAAARLMAAHLTASPFTAARIMAATLAATALGGPQVSAQPAPRPGPGPLPAALHACLGERQPLSVASQMPYVLVSVGGRQGQMVLDFGATLSTITPGNFQGVAEGQPAPEPLPGQPDLWAGFVFFGPWDPVRLQPQPAPAVQARAAAAAGGWPLAQAGVLGTDLLSSATWTLDYAGASLWRAPAGRGCGDAALRAAGFTALSTAGAYASDARTLSCPADGGPGCGNIPTVPLRIGPLTVPAQLDTGYDDSRQPGAININGALFDALRTAGVALRPRPDIALQLSTCVAGVSERIDAWQLAPAAGARARAGAGAGVAFVDVDGRPVQRGPREVTLFVKRTPAAAAVCGGIGTWRQPAAQLGASFVAGGALVVDAARGRVWLR
jgi:hypothetical protein